MIKLTDTDMLNGHDTAIKKGQPGFQTCIQSMPTHLVADSKNKKRAANWIAGYYIGVAANMMEKHDA